MSRCLTILILFAALLGRADGVADKLGSQGIAEFNAAYRAWDAQRFDTAAQMFRQACTNTPDSATNYYWLGVAHFHRMLCLRNQSTARTNNSSASAANASMDAALTALNMAVKLNDRHAESHALLGALYGMKIDGNLIRGMQFGPRVQKHQDKALKFGADNPRVRYLLGTCQFHTAKSSSSQREALATFLAAEKLFASEARGETQPLELRWGYSSCLTFIGRTYELLNQRAEAAGYFRKALDQHPADHIAKAGLDRVTEKK